MHNNDGLKEIIRHEFVHVKQKHTIDILFTEILCIINWYNPFAWLIRHAVRQNLEFIADNNVLQNGFDKKDYQYLLLKVIGVSQFSIAQQFNFSSLKKRIIMMNKIKSARVHLVRFLFVLPLVAVLLLAFIEKHNDIVQSSVLEATVKNGIDTVPGTGSLSQNVKSIDVYNSKATVKLKNGKLEKYNLNNEREMAAFTKNYGALPPPPPPLPLPPVAPVPPVPPVPDLSVPPAAPLPPVPDELSTPPVAPDPPTPSVPPLPPAAIIKN